MSFQSVKKIIIIIILSDPSPATTPEIKGRYRRKLSANDLSHSGFVSIYILK